MNPGFRQHGGKQFGSFDGKDNRRDLWRLLVRLGKGVSPEEAWKRRYSFAEAMAIMVNGGHISEGAEMTVSHTYWILCGLATVFGLDLDQAARLLERWVRKLEGKPGTRLRDAL